MPGATPRRSRRRVTPGKAAGVSFRPRRLQAALFDFDGVIMDSETALYESWRNTYAAHGCHLPLDKWAANVGGYNYDVFDPLAYLEEQTGRALDRDVVNGARRACYLHRVYQLGEMPGISDAFAAVKSAGLKLAAVSSSSRNWVPAHLKRLNLLSCFDAIVCGDEVDNVKPDPAVYHLALNRLRADPDRVFVVEDSPKGVAAARAASLYCIAVPNSVTRASRLHGYDKLLESLDKQPFTDVLGEVEKELADRYAGRL
ncbi:MAG TPA: HAD family hydrolase [Candidatus Hydrogenedentes bacterium]|nr:HAD family hydrolase [Candidatus Hydrogenedentota bacterium]